MIGLTLQFDSLSDLTSFFHMVGAAGALQTQLNRMEGLLNISLTNEGRILMNEQQMQAALTKIDTATTAAAANLATLATTTAATATSSQTISDEMDAFITAAQSAGVSQSLLDQANAISTKVDANATSLQAVSDSLTQHAAFLTGVASKGATDPVPVPVPPVPPAPPVAA